MLSVSPPAQDDRREIDPFGYWPHAASAARPLGGEAPAPEPSYVFHSAYEPMSAGPKTVTIDFDDLIAPEGTLLIRVFRLGAGNAVTQSASTEAGLRKLARTRSPATISFEAEGEASYAVMGHLMGSATEIAASAIRLTVEARSADADSGERTRSLMGQGTARRDPAMLLFGSVSFAAPLSQPFTPDQVSEPEFASWTAEAGIGHLAAPEQWDIAYVLRTLEVYGRLVDGASGVGIGTEDDPVAASAVRRGCLVSSVALAPDGLAVPEGGPTMQDFVWMRSAVLANRSQRQINELIDDALDLIAPAGMGVFVVRAASAPVQRTTNGALTFEQVKQLALRQVAAGHFVAQLRAPPPLPAQRWDEVAPPVPFGLIIRKAVETS